jgi:16S rRNA (adenine1518-N6/adenine1519-N6)-dimethyltransferase
MSLLTAADVRALASRLDLRPTKTLGQNFVIDPNTVRRLVRTAGVGVDDVVVEVGPGLGSLTLGLLEVASRVVAVEIDPVLAASCRRPSRIGCPSGRTGSRSSCRTR